MGKKEKMSAGDLVRSVQWALKLAYRIDRKMLILWAILNVVLSIIPAISLNYQKTILSLISSFGATGAEYYEKVIAPVIFYGILLVIMGISVRLNAEFISTVMYDAYYLGQQNELIEYAEQVSVEKLMDKRNRDDYINTVLSDSSLVIFISSFCVLLGRIVGSLSLLIVAWRNSKIVFFVTLVYTLFALVLSSSFISKTKQNDRYIRAQRTKSNYYENLCKDLGAAKEIRLYDTANRILRQWEDAFEPTEQYDKKRYFNIELQGLISGITFYAFIFVVLVFSLVAVQKGTMEPASLLMQFSLYLNLFNTISDVMKTYLTIYDALYFLNLQRKLLSNEMSGMSSKCNDDQPAKLKPYNIENAIEANQLSYIYPNGTSALEDVTLEVKHGEIVALLGKNGSGKSTLIKVLAGILTPSSGKLFISGGHSDIGVFFQDSFLFHKSLRENIAYGDIKCLNETQKIELSLTQAGGKNILNKLSDGIESIIGKRVLSEGVELSGGEKQCVGVARALFSNRNIMFFDEPAAALDPIAEVEQFKSIQSKLEGKAAILVSHRIGFARLADRIIVLEKGKIVECGTHEELLKKNGEYTALYQAQAKYYV